MKRYVFVLIMSVLCGCSSLQPVPHPFARTLKYVLDERKKMQPKLDLLAKRKLEAQAEYDNLLAKEHSFMAELNDEELKAYEEYINALKSEANLATLHRTNRELKRLLEPKKKYLALIALRGEKYYVSKKLESLHNCKERFRYKLEMNGNRIRNFRHKPRHQLTGNDYLEMSRIRQEADELRQLLEEFHKDFEQTYIEAKDDVTKQVNE